VVQVLTQRVTYRILETPKGEAYIGVGEQEPVASGLPGTEVKSVGLAQPSFRYLLGPDHPQNVRRLGREPCEDLPGAVGRAVVDGHDLESTRVALGKNGT
jgi:hypothetical protein